MNIALEQTEEYVNGQLKNKYGDAFIRGNNGTYVIESEKTRTPLRYFSVVYCMVTLTASVQFPKLLYSGLFHYLQNLLESL